MIVDSSAIIAILEREPEAESFVDRLLAAGVKLMAAPTFLETCMVAGRRRGMGGISEVEDLIRVLAVKIAPFDERAARYAVGAYDRFGKGRHPEQFFPIQLVPKATKQFCNVIQATQLPQESIGAGKVERHMQQHVLYR